MEGIGGQGSAESEGKSAHVSDVFSGWMRPNSLGGECMKALQAGKTSSVWVEPCRS